MTKKIKDDIYKSIMGSYKGWFDASIEEMKEAFPQVQREKIKEFGRKCGIHPASNPGYCGYQGSLSPQDFEELYKLCEEENDKTKEIE